MARGKPITDEEYKAIQQALDSGIPIARVSKMFNRCFSTVSRIKNGTERRVFLPDVAEEENTDIDFVLKLSRGKYKQLCSVSRFYGFTSNAEFVMSCINEKYLEAKTEIDMMTEKEMRQRQFDEEFAKLKEKYADLFERRTEESVD